MTSHQFAKVVRGKRTVAEFTPAFVWESLDPANPLHGSIVGAGPDVVVVTDGRRMIPSLRSEVVFA